MLKVAHTQRYLWDELSFAGLNDDEVYKFTGWRKGGTIGSYTMPMKFNPKNDKKVFDNHPAWKWWF